MKKTLGVLILTVLYTCCSAQLYRLEKVLAFFTVSAPGTQLVDDNGNKVNPVLIIDRFIYLECKFNGKPKIDSILYNGVLFTASVADKEEKTATIGIKKDNGKPVMLKAKKGNHIWRIDLIQPPGKTLQPESVKKILIKGKLDKQKFSYTIYKEVEMPAPDRY
jgi:hypothetical protein